MNRASILMSALALCIPAWAQDPIVFRSDVSLVRVDAQVVDHDNRAITHLQADDFVVREEGRPAPIRNFASENMPIDVLFLLDVSASMRPHVQRIADASGQALTVLGKDDHMAIMVFDRYTRVRLPFSGNHQEVQRAFDHLLRQEGFNGGTDITRAMLDAADYIRREGRQEARRAIVILTDDETEFNRDEAAVSRALARADAVMCALIAPDAMAGQRYPGGGGGQRRGTWGSGGGLGGPLGGVILGPGGGGPWGGNRYPRGGGGRGRASATQSAGTAEIARDSGGDSMSVNDASALEETLMRLRQRYALFFNLPEGVAPGQERNIVVDLSPEARRRYPDAEVHYRRAYMSGNSDRDHGPTIVRHAPADPDYSAPATSVSRSTSSDDPAPTRRRRVAVNEDGSPISGTSDDSTPAAVQPAGRDTSPAPASPSGGWPKATPPGQQ